MRDKQTNLDERLEAVAHTLELVAAKQVKTERSINRLGQYARAIVMDREARLLALQGDADRIETDLNKGEQ